MADGDVDRLVSAARTELRDRLDVSPPDLGRLAQQARTRRRALSGVVATLVLVAFAVPLALRDREGGSQVVAGPSLEESNADLLRPGESRALPESPLAGRSTMAAVWTGDEMLIWGGDGPNGQFDDGATYDPLADAWTLLPDAPLSVRNAPAAVWTGEEVVLWGGSSSAGSYRDGAAYNPVTRRWRPITPAPFASAGRPVALWTGSEMIVLAGFNSRDAAAYDPVDDRWRPLPNLPGQLQAPNPVGVWAGDEVVTVVQSGGTLPSAAPELVSLRVDGDAWSTVRDLPSGQAVLAWTGDALLVAAGRDAFEVSGGESRPIAAAPSGVQVADTPVVWTGTELLLWEGDTASAIDPQAGTWQAIPSGDSSRRTQPALVWADGVLLAWGGFPNHAGGVMLRPPVPAQTSKDTAGQPSTGKTGVPRQFEVSGVMQMVGGPPGASPTPAPAPGTINALDPGGVIVATVATAADGTFTLQAAYGQLPPCWPKRSLPVWGSRLHRRGDNRGRRRRRRTRLVHPKVTVYPRIQQSCRGLR